MKIQQVLFHLSIRNEQRREEVTQWLRSHAPRTFAQQARFGKVAPAVIATLETWDILMPALAPLKQFVVELSNQRSFFDREIQDLQNWKGIEPQSILILKGRALQRWYPTNLPSRQSFDMDFVIEDEEQFWQVGQWLINRGYETPTMGAAYPDRAGQKNWHFILSYEKKIPEAKPDASTSRAVIEMLQGVTSLSLRHFFDLRPLITRARHATKQSPSPKEHITPFFLYPTREDCLLAILVEISERKLEVRDAVDFYMLMGMNKGDVPLPLNWRAASRTIEEEFLMIQFLRLASYYMFVSGNSLPQEIEQTYRQWRRQSISWKYVARSPELSLIVFYYAHHFRWTYALKEVFLNFWESALDSSLLEKLPFRQSRALNYDQVDYLQTLARLLYLTAEQRGPRQWLRGRGGELFLCTPIGTFLATRSVSFTSNFLEDMHSQLAEDQNVPVKESQKS